MIAKTLRTFLLTCPTLATAGITAKNFAIDLILETGVSMSIQMQQGTLEASYIGGDNIINQPFTLFFRSPLPSIEKNDSMMETLNEIGKWLVSQALPSLGSDYVAQALYQNGTANIADQSEGMITYQATFVLELTRINK